jgi:hypothetical protein
LSKTDTHDASRYGLLIIADTTILGKLVRNLAITEAFLAHHHHHLIVGVQLVRDALVIGRKALALAAVATTEGTRDARRLLVKEVVVFVQDEGLSIVVLAAHSEALDSLMGLGRRSLAGALTLAATGVVIVLRIVGTGLVLVVIFWDTEIIKAIELEVIVIGLL